ncbi:MAG: hypothetical protein R3F56_17080 [Planctomycetota bacterium]
MRSSLALTLALLCHLALAGGYWLVTPALEAPREEDYVEAGSRAALGFGCDDAYTAMLAAGMCALGERDLVATAIPAVGPGALRLQHGADEAVGSRAQATLGALRVLSVLLGLVSIACTHAIARHLHPASGVPAVASLMLACMPQWAFSHAVLWHGPLLVAAAHLLLLLQVRQLSAAAPSVRGALAAGIVAALALGTAHAGWVVVALGLLGQGLVLAHAPRRGTLSLTLFVAVASAGLLAQPPRPHVVDPRRDALDLVRSFVAEFGRGALGQPRLPELLTLAMVAAAAIGWLLGGRRLCGRARPTLLVSFACSLGTMAGVAAAADDGWHGRHLLVAGGPMMIMTAVGLVTLWRRVAPAALQRAASHPFAALLPFLPSCLVLVAHVRPALRLPPTFDARFVTLHAGLRTRPAHELTAEAVRLDSEARVVLSWHPIDSDAEATDPYAVVGWYADGRVAFASHARDGILLRGTTLALDRGALGAWRDDERVWWRAYTVTPPAESTRTRWSPVQILDPRPAPPPVAAPGSAGR